MRNLLDDEGDAVASLEKSKRLLQGELEEVRDQLAEANANAEKQRKKAEVCYTVVFSLLLYN